MMRHLRRQRGLILIVSLILLLILTLLTLTALQTSTLEVKMRTNEVSRSVAFQAAESGLREAEQFITSSDPVFNPIKLIAGPFQGTDCVAGLCPLTMTPLWSASTFNWISKGRALSVNLSNSFQTPRTVIEMLSHTPSSDGNGVEAIFRITTRAWGMDSNTVVQLQSYFSLKAENSRRVAWREIVN